ncbi:hypothetical protein LSCM1_00560 [Leishmania martiniquensis]|uniref:Uncharacterized protein n=1 Tax=Leishmania martiniquensis TaxID=1580590 RepID=A0A836K9Y5_9TRYP|nr:hypothetical protein LSCM1_00560 [Leishmania martiniquensis]
MDTTSASAALGERGELSEQEVLGWLSRRGFTRAHAALVAEASSRALMHDDSPPRMCVTCDGAAEVTASDAVTTVAELQAELRDSVMEALSAYRDLTCDDDLFALLELWDPQLSSRYAARLAEYTEAKRSGLEKRALEAEESSARLRIRERELDAQLRQTVAIIADRLQTLASSVDPMRKDILIPLIRTVAVLGSSGTMRAAARHMMLTLYKRPMTEHRMAIVQEWLRVAQEAPSRSLEQEMIPELYTLVNAQAFERRLLALDCAASVAPLLRCAPQVRYSLCQGLLRPLCEDNTSVVRRELPRCFSLLWGGAADIGATATRDAHALAGSVSRSNMAGGTPPERSALHWPSTRPSAECSSGASFAPLSPIQKTFFMELLVRLATDSSSRTVRQAAQTQLCEVLYSVFLRDGVLLTRFVPLLLAVIQMEATQLLLLKGPDKNVSDADVFGARNASASAVAGGERRKGASEESSTSVAAALSLSNVMTLIQLLHAALRCAAAELLHSREAEGQRDGCEAGAASQTSSSLASAYVRVVLPFSYNLLSLLLSKLRFVSLVLCGGGGTLSGSDASTRLCGPLCALCATLASLAPLLGAEAWQEVAHYLEGSLLSNPQHGGEFTEVAESTLATAASTPSSPPSPPPQLLLPRSSPDVSLTQHSLERGRLLFVLSFFLFLCGDAATLPTGGAGAPAADDAASQEKKRDMTSGGAASPLRAPPFESFSREHIQGESLRFVARRISLSNEDLSCPRSAPLMACVHCVAALAPFATASHEMASGISGLVNFLVASPEVRQRLTAVVLAHDTCLALANERLKVSLLLEPLTPLLEDPQPSVKEAALSAVLSASVSLTESRAQERALRPVLRVADATGCTSRLTRCLLQQFYQLIQRMPAEPREALLYPQLAVLMDRLAELYVARVSQEGFPPASVAGPSPPLTSAMAEARNAPGEGGIGDSRDVSVQDWEDTMLALQALLNSIVKCAVVTPTLVYRYLLPGIQQLSSDGVLSRCSLVVRARWLRLRKNYFAFMENNNAIRLAAGRAVAPAGTPNVGKLLDRFKDELKRRL